MWVLIYVIAVSLQSLFLPVAFHCPGDLSFFEFECRSWIKKHRKNCAIWISVWTFFMENLLDGFRTNCFPLYFPLFSNKHVPCMFSHVSHSFCHEKHAGFAHAFQHVFHVCFLCWTPTYRGTVYRLSVSPPKGSGSASTYPDCLG